MLKKIIKYSTTWCGPCRTFAPIFREVSEMDKYKDITFISKDAETDEDAYLECQKYNIRNVPTTVFLDENDELIIKVGGALPKDTFVRIIDERM